MAEKSGEQELQTEIWTALSEVFRSFFARDSIQIGPETTAADIAEWDSLNHVQLILAVETRFKIRFKAVEVAAFENVGDMVAVIQRRLAA